MFHFLKRGVAAKPSLTSTPTLPVSSLPADVLTLLQRRDDINDAELSIHLLDEQRALTRLDASGVWGRLGLVTLDDAEDSNPYVLITRGVCAGNVSDVRLSISGFVQWFDLESERLRGRADA